jgi:CDP-glucose 4,6-dehydratase
VEGLGVRELGEFFRDRSVLVTGHTGFKGGWLVTWLKRLGARVTGFALPAGTGGLFETAAVGDDIASVLGDVGELPALTDAVTRCAPEIVFHLAAQPLVRRAHREPVLTFATNVMGTVHVLEAARGTPSVRAVLVVTTDKCYANREWVWGYREDDALGGHDPYSASKAAAELVTAAYRQAYFHGDGRVAVASARAGNVIGGGDWAEDRLVPDLIRGLQRGLPVVLRRPRAVRPWQFVLEPLRGYLMLAQRLVTDGPAFAEAWNFGPHEESVVAVEALARQVVARWGSGELVIARDASPVAEAHSLRLDSSKARAQLGWRPWLGLDEAVALTVEWYRGHALDRAAGARITVAQIERYAARGGG